MEEFNGENDLTFREKRVLKPFYDKLFRDPEATA